ncbi:hypothetical protein TNCV_4759231 [Trichonephila clavipes]|nr:hypothetical protein TNCV_4759231 [Trichonephila clavipes]
MSFSQAPSYGSRRLSDPSEGATCAWMAANEVVGCTCAFVTMWRSSRRLVCRGSPDPSFLNPTGVVEVNSTGADRAIMTREGSSEGAPTEAKGF